MLYAWLPQLISTNMIVVYIIDNKIGNEKGAIVVVKILLSYKCRCDRGKFVSGYIYFYHRNNIYKLIILLSLYYEY